MEKAAAINPVVLVIVRNVIGHNFFVRLMIGICFTSVLTDLVRVYSQKSWSVRCGELTPVTNEGSWPLLFLKRELKRSQLPKALSGGKASGQLSMVRRLRFELLLKSLQIVSANV